MFVYLTSLGCRLNEAELQTWSNDFLSYGFKIASDIKQADLMVINTCAVTGEAARKSRQSIRRLHRQNSQAKLVVTGCYASLEKEQAETILGVDLIVDNKDKNILPKLAKETLDWSAMPYAATEPDETPLFERNRERAFIKVQDGCRYRCTYCIVTIARGEEKSRSIDDITSEVRLLHSQGVQEIVITGVHVGGYGSDIESNLFELTKAIIENTRIPRIRFASVEPWDLSDEFFGLFKNPRLMPHMHLPIQSGSDRILKKMSRRCQTESFLQLLHTAREVVADFNITSDVIVGFPGEAEDDFIKSVSMVEQSSFGHVHVFSYSSREGTKAAGLANHLDGATKKMRSKHLQNIANKVKLENQHKMIGRRVSILWEGKGKRLENGMVRYTGYTPNYYKVQTDVNGAIKLTNQILESKLTGISKEQCIVAEIAKEQLENINSIDIDILELEK